MSYNRLMTIRGTGKRAKAQQPAAEAAAMLGRPAKAPSSAQLAQAVGYSPGRRLGIISSEWRRGGEGVTIGWRRLDSSLGPVLLAGTVNGVCHLSFGKDEAVLRKSFPRAELIEGGLPKAIAKMVLARIECADDSPDAPLDLAGTPFQQRVWAQLREIPRGETRSYAEVATSLGASKASRAVGGANAANPVAVLVPCHRVIAADGSLGGYAWGEAIKRELLRREKQLGKAEREADHTKL